MTEFTASCAHCGLHYAATRADSRYCSGSHRALASQHRLRAADDARHADLIVFRTTAAHILKRLSQMADDPTGLEALRAEAAELVPRTT